MGALSPKTLHSNSPPTNIIQSLIHPFTMTLPKTYKQAVFKEKGGKLSIEEVELKSPPKGHLLIKVEACGVCHSDTFAQADAFGVGL
jgi:hypothetical protein